MKMTYRIGPRNDRTRRDRNIINLAEPPVRAAGDTARIEVLRGRGKWSGPIVDLFH